jgi:hypothetical protein
MAFRNINGNKDEEIVSPFFESCVTRNFPFDSRKSLEKNFKTYGLMVI